ncbi:hypothetical protein [Arthrobacter sp. UYCu712]|uniref:hypothetical protein n=1 Tax=Arthrobacter sp. UYCu712 TaxID=3156340 RepID=UPI00339482CA
MDFELRVIPGCPNVEDAQALFVQALALEAPGSAAIRLTEITTDDQAKALAYHGSPTFAADGRDLFPASGEAAISCRIYSSGQRLAGLPPLSELRSAVRAALPGIPSTADSPADTSCGS